MALAMGLAYRVHVCRRAGAPRKLPAICVVILLWPDRVRRKSPAPPPPLTWRCRQAYNSSASLIQQSWDAATATVSLDVVGGCIYETLFEIAPNLRHLFSKPKEIMGMKLVGPHPAPCHPTPFYRSMQLRTVSTRT